MDLKPTANKETKMYRKLTIAASTLALAAAICTSTPKPAEAFFVLPVVAAAAMFGAFATGGIMGSFLQNPQAAPGVKGYQNCKSGSTYGPDGHFDGYATVCH